MFSLGTYWVGIFLSYVLFSCFLSIFIQYFRNKLITRYLTRGNFGSTSIFNQNTMSSLRSNSQWINALSVRIGIISTDTWWLFRFFLMCISINLGWKKDLKGITCEDMNWIRCFYFSPLTNSFYRFNVKLFESLLFFEKKMGRKKKETRLEELHINTIDRVCGWKNKAAYSNSYLRKGSVSNSFSPHIFWNW